MDYFNNVGEYNNYGNDEDKIIDLSFIDDDSSLDDIYIDTIIHSIDGNFSQHSTDSIDDGYY